MLSEKNWKHNKEAGKVQLKYSLKNSESEPKSGFQFHQANRPGKVRGRNLRVSTRTVG